MRWIWTLSLNSDQCSQTTDDMSMDSVPFSQMVSRMCEISISNAVSTVERFPRVIAQWAFHLRAAPMAPILIVCGDMKIFWCTVA